MSFLSLDLSECFLDNIQDSVRGCDTGDPMHCLKTDSITDPKDCNREIDFNQYDFGTFGNIDFDINPPSYFPDLLNPFNSFEETDDITTNPTVDGRSTFDYMECSAGTYTLNFGI